MTKRTICYVDDDEDEIRRFRQYLGNDYILGAGTTLDAALNELKTNRVSKPDIVLLDLYFGPLPDEKKREEMIKADVELAKMERKVRELLVAAGLAPEEGFKLADEAGKRCRRVPRAFFSRRAFLEDVMRAHEKGLPLLEKPDPDDGESYDMAFQRHRAEIKRKIDRIISLNSFWVRNWQRIEGFVAGLLLFLVKIGYEWL